MGTWSEKNVTWRKSVRKISKLGSSPIADEADHSEMSSCSSPDTSDIEEKKKQPKRKNREKKVAGGQEEGGI